VRGGWERSPPVAHGPSAGRDRQGDVPNERRWRIRPEHQEPGHQGRHTELTLEGRAPVRPAPSHWRPYRRADSVRGSYAPSLAQLTREWRAQWRAAVISVNFSLQIATSAGGLRIRVRRFDSSRGHSNSRPNAGNRMNSRVRRAKTLDLRGHPYRWRDVGTRMNKRYTRVRNPDVPGGAYPGATPGSRPRAHRDDGFGNLRRLSGSAAADCAGSGSARVWGPDA
jgi:hypothetical protein